MLTPNSCPSLCVQTCVGCCTASHQNNAKLHYGNPADFELHVPHFSIKPGEVVAVVGRVGSGALLCVELRRGNGDQPVGTWVGACGVCVCAAHPWPGLAAKAPSGPRTACLLAPRCAFAPDACPRPNHAGKSSILQAILSKMVVAQGSVTVGGSIAYVPQTPWVQNLSLRDNILFGLPFDEVRYKAVIHACALELDLKILPQGELRGRVAATSVWMPTVSKPPAAV